MSTVFMVNGTKKELSYMYNGIDCSADFIGNTEHGMSTDVEGRYIATQEDFEWWSDTIEAHEEMDNVVSEYMEKYGADAVEKVIYSVSANDLNDIPNSVISALQTLD